MNDFGITSLALGLLALAFAVWVKPKKIKIKDDKISKNEII